MCRYILLDLNGNQKAGKPRNQTSHETNQTQLKYSQKTKRIAVAGKLAKYIQIIVIAHLNIHENVFTGNEQILINRTCKNGDAEGHIRWAAVITLITRTLSSIMILYPFWHQPAITAQ